MSTVTFLGTGTGLGKFTVDDIIISSPLVPGEKRLYAAFPYPTLELWRRHALVATASIFELPTQCRTTVLFAHEGDMGTVFYELTGLDPAVLAGFYNFKKKGVLADQELAMPLSLKLKALEELKQQGIPDQHIQLINSRLDSQQFNQRVTGICAAVYITALLLEQAEA